MNTNNNQQEKKIVFPLLGSIINVQAYKYNGELYRQWNGVKVLRNTEQHYVLFLSKTKVAETKKRDWIYRDPVIWFLPKNEMSNALVLLKPKNNYIYINLSSKPIYEDNTIKFIDFDIDVKKYPGKNLSIVDLEEFDENRKKYNYPLELVNRIEKALEDVVNKHLNKEYYNSQEIIDYYINLAKKDKSLSQNFRAKKTKIVFKNRKFKQN
ncbi:DUF402 domain-containing protein [Mycoplasmopsis columbina]|uniref:Rnase g and e associated domain containing protein n=1 Tax=Mycoplasmopsis columbina SF7 TaxID=1037410 RepID=F9UKE8_9BACT|nr:DUF402 domain-containing protein [Mycoplasmopsis columbina]EGV00153.1 rnase g and e associated domain containing protein [Mycoplasmopsis columbina SF7]VEU77046.1 Protein of uncharacterised function (DUF402) [Mycoplasmopsis columbina]